MNTGDLTKAVSYNTKASAFPFTKVAVADLAAANNMLNQAHLSGKKDGAGFIGDDYYLYIATGDQPTDPWQRTAPAWDGTAMVAVVITPA